MGKIDTSKWKEFLVGDLFEAYLSKDDIQPKNFVKGKIPLVSSGKENNGIIAFVEDEKARLWEENTLTIDMFGKVFYQESPYFAVSHGRVNILLPKISMTKGCLQFIGCAIEKVASQKYAFNEMCTGTKVLKNNIKLPSTPDGAPDWAYMESYMANLETKVAESLTMLQAAKDAEKKKVDTREWKEFRIGDYFKVEYGRFHAKDELGAGTVNYITTSGFNNGITNTCEEAAHQGNCITVASDGAMGASFYQEEAFTTSNIVSTLTPMPHTPLNKYNAFFLCAIIFGKRAEFGWLGFKMSVDRVRNLRVKLPSTPDGQPDWVYMEEYMRKVEERVKATMGKLEKKCYVS